MSGAGTIWWDFDGTLVSRPLMWSEAGHRLLDAHRPELGIVQRQVGEMLRTGFPWHTPDAAHPELNEPDDWWDAVYRRYHALFAQCGWDDADTTAPFARIREHIIDASAYRVFEDALPTLEQLQRRGWRHLIVSNHVPELPDIVAGLGLAEFFDAVVTSARVGYEKPHPALFSAAQALTGGIDPIWMVGDNPEADCRGADRFGVNAVLVRTQDGFTPRLSCLSELPAFLAE